jgi:predicted F0F1-ATPase subunit
VFSLNGKNNKNMLQNLSLITQVGLSIVTPIIIGVYLGGFIDKKVGTDMIFTLIFIILGAGAGFLNLFKLADKNKNNRK